MYYSKLKILHYKDKLDTLVKEPTAPLHVRIKPTNACNHNCVYCSYQNSYGQLGKDMDKKDSIPFEKMSEIIQNCYDIGVKAVTFSGGGEPLVYKNIKETLKLAKRRDLKIGILTNGSLLFGDIADTVSRCATWVRISMDGWDNVSYKHYRNCGEKDFDRLIKNIGEFMCLETNCVLGVNIIVDDYNARHVFDLVKLVYSLGVRSIKISPCIISNESKVNNAYHLKIASIVNGELAKIFAAGINVYNSYHLQLEGFKKEYTWCPYIQILPIIGADLNVYCCHDKAYNKDTGILGSIKDKSFTEMWFDGKEKFYKINPSLHCNHHCITDNTNKMILEYLAVEHREFV
jgi:MoaA/NifB/PqqE/SkfB family radical SAM enzyme